MQTHEKLCVFSSEVITVLSVGKKSSLFVVRRSWGSDIVDIHKLVIFTCSTNLLSGSINRGIGYIKKREKYKNIKIF